MIILITNKLAAPEHNIPAHTATDDVLIDEALTYLKSMCELIDDRMVRKLYNGCCGLRDRAATAVAGQTLRKHSDDHTGSENAQAQAQANARMLSWPTMLEFHDSLAEPSQKWTEGLDPAFGLWPADFAVLVNVTSRPEGDH